MSTKTLILLLSILVVLTPLAVCAVEEPVKPDDESAAEATVKVSVAADRSDVVKVLESIAEQSGERIIIESTVKGKVTFSVEEAPLETALGALANAGGFDWRKVYVAADSKLLDKPDRFAATVRLMSGFSFPDLVIAEASTNKLAVHCENPDAVKTAEGLATEKLGMSRVYLVTNDAAVAKKAVADKEENDKAESDKVSKYTNMSEEQMQMFMEMTPEEREQAIVESFALMEQIGPEYMGSVMEAMWNSDPDVLAQMTSRQTQILFEMPTDMRRKMLRMNMEMMSNITPEQQQMLQEDIAAIGEEIRNGLAGQ